MLLLEQFQTLTLYPQNASNLKELVLQLAVQGKLTESWRNQNSLVEPAAELLNRISEEKARLIKEKKIKKEDPLPPITEEETPFKLPQGWLWSRFQDITSLITCGIASTPKYYSEGKVFLSAKNVKPFKFLPEDHKYVDEETYRKITQNAKPELNDILITRVGAGIGETALIDKEIDFAFYVSLTLVKPIKILNSKFLVYWLNSPSGIQNAISFTSGNGSSQGNLNVGRVRSFAIPLPPLEEQEAIVARVEELMAKIEELEKQTVERIELKKKVGASLLQQLTIAANEEMEQNWLFLKEHFQTIFDEDDNVKKLRETILQLAVQGKLTQAWRKQHPDAEPASELLKRIGEEKARLIKEKKIKKEDLLRTISEEKRPYELPEGWVWCKLGTVIDLISGQHIDSSDYNEIGQGYPYLTGPSDFGEIHPIFTKWTEKPKVFANKDDILITVKGSGVGKLNILHKDQIVISRQLMAIRPFTIPNNYIFLFLKSEYESFQRQKVGIAIPGIGREDILYKYIPLPPFAEQQAIINRVAELLSLCDELEQQINRSKQEAERLMQAALYEALHVKEEVEL